MLGRNRKNIFEAERIEIVSQIFFRAGVAFVHDKGNGLADLAQHGREFAVGGGDFAAAIDQEDHLRGLLQRDARLGEDLARDVIGIADDDSARVDQLEPAAFVRRGAVDAIARNAWLIADDRAALSGDAVEKGGFADVRPSDDYYRREYRSAVLF